MVHPSHNSASRRILRATANLTPVVTASAVTVLAAQAVFPTNVQAAVGITALAWATVAAASLANRLSPNIITEVQENPLTTLIDSESGLGNARQLDEVLHREIARSVRYGDRSALAVFDIQVGGFNPVNPGEHPPSPARHVAKVLVNGVREADTVLRLDRSRFVVVLSECEEDDGDALVGRIRTQISTSPYARNDDGSGIYARAWGAVIQWGPGFRTPEAYVRAALLKLEESRGEYEAAQTWFAGKVNGERQAPQRPAHRESA